MDSNFELENRQKYGEKEIDIISEQFEINFLCGVGFCCGNIKKYLKRYISNSPKAKNEIDLNKAIDYANRLNKYYTYKIDTLVTLIQNKLINEAIELLSIIQTYILGNRLALV